MGQKAERTAALQHMLKARRAGVNNAVAQPSWWQISFPAGFLCWRWKADAPNGTVSCPPITSAGQEKHLLTLTRVSGSPCLLRIITGMRNKAPLYPLWPKTNTLLVLGSLSPAEWREKRAKKQQKQVLLARCLHSWRPVQPHTDLRGHNEWLGHESHDNAHAFSDSFFLRSTALLYFVVPVLNRQRWWHAQILILFHSCETFD